jgi:hypothetical protein
VVHAVRRSFSALSDTHAIALGQAFDVIAFPAKNEVGGTVPAQLRYYHAVDLPERGSVPEVLGNDVSVYMTIGYEHGFGHDAAAKELGVQTSAHPVLRFHYETRSGGNGRRLDSSAVVLLPVAEEYLWVPPDLRGGEQFTSLRKPFAEPLASLPVRSLAFHTTTKLATKWQDGKSWIDLFLFFNFCTRELLLVSLREDEWYSANPTLDWAVQTDPLSFWIFGSLRIEAQHQFGSMPLHRAATAKDPRLLRQVLATGPELEVEDHRTGGTALHVAAAAGDVEACEMLRRAGASVEATDDIGRKPVDVASTDAVKICLT